jgi:hypothetical protein
MYAAEWESPGHSPIGEYPGTIYWGTIRTTGSVTQL